MDFHAAVETFTEAWVAAKTATKANGQMTRSQSLEDVRTQLSRDGFHLEVTKTTTPTTKPRPVVPRPHPQLSPSSTGARMDTLSTSLAEESPGKTTVTEAANTCNGTRSLPIHCIVEQTSGPPTFESGEKSAHNSVELDSYAILPGTTPLIECVRAALVKLGYTSTETHGAKGAIQLKNWKPLCFEAITDNKCATIEDILGELTQVATLRIRISSASKFSSAEEVKEKLLQLLLSQSQSLLANAGCPDKMMSSNGQTLATLSPEMRRAFDRWYDEQLKLYTDGSLANGGSGPVNMAAAAKELLALQQERFNMAVAGLQHGMSRDHLDKDIHTLSPLRHQVSPPISRPMASSTPTEASTSLHPALQHYLPGKTRMRTSFDPEHEIPRLQKWFADNQHPSRELMLQYLGELNSLDSRKGRRPLDLTNIIYWFKNARAAHRRAAKSSEEDSFEAEEEKDLSVDSLPFLPNRNAVYMVPYPHFPSMGINNHMGLLGAQGKFNGHIDDRQPCDLSLKSNSSRHRSPSQKEEHVDLKDPVNESKAGKNSREDEKEQPVSLLPNGDIKQEQHEAERETQSEKVYAKCEETCQDEVSKMPNEDKREVGNDDKKSEIKTREEEEKKERSMKDDHNQNNDRPRDFRVERKESHDSDEPTDLSRSSVKVANLKHHSVDDDDDNDMTPNDLSCKRPHDHREHDQHNGKREYESDDDLESDYEDNRSIDGSLSSQDDSKMASLRETYLSAAARGLNFSPVTSSPSSTQPLHIPQFPHPLAMHYFPLNTHYYSQQANQMKFHNGHHSPQQSVTKPSPGHGQENNSHRKRRTRVFIDPLTEIPKLEKWFLDDTHPSSYMIDKYCEELNNSEYRQKFPRLEPKNVQLWFKNHRAKVKRMRLGGVGDHMMFD